MTFGLAESIGALDQQRRVFCAYDYTAGLIYKQNLLPHYAASGLAAIPLVGEDYFDKHGVARKQGRFESDLVPAERCDRGSLVHLALEPLHKRETIKSVRYGTAKTRGLAVFLVRVQWVVVQSDICERKDVLICYDVRCCRQIGIYFHIVVVELGDLCARHLCFLISTGRVIEPIRTQRN